MVETQLGDDQVGWFAFSKSKCSDQKIGFSIKLVQWLSTPDPAKTWLAQPIEKVDDEPSLSTESLNEYQTQTTPFDLMRPVFQELVFGSLELGAKGYDVLDWTVRLDLPELGISGDAIVTSIEPVFSIEDGSGQAVTATFKHSSGDILDLTIESNSSDTETIGTTSNHPFWSYDREEFVQAGNLDIGERLETWSGETKRVVTKLARPGPAPVYNLEVSNEHVYFVGANGLLVHNSYGRRLPKKVMSEAEIAYRNGKRAERMMRNGRLLSAPKTGAGLADNVADAVNPRFAIETRCLA